MSRLVLVAAAAMTSLLSVPVLAEDWEGDVPPGKTYICDEGSNTEPFIQFVMPSAPNGDAYLMLESESLGMAPVPVASGFGYDVIVPAGHFMVKGKGDDVMLYVGDQAPKKCIASETYYGDTASAGDTGYLSQYGNYSLGGKVRSGPGMGYEQVGSLPYGTPIAIVRRTEVSMDGYDWFQIEWDMNRAFQWGGIICSNGLHVAGVYEECPSDLD